MEREYIASLETDVIRVTGKKENKEYDFLTLEVKLQDYKFTLYPKKEDKKLFDYLLDEETN